MVHSMNLQTSKGNGTSAFDCHGHVIQECQGCFACATNLTHKIYPVEAFVDPFIDMDISLCEPTPLATPHDMRFSGTPSFSSPLVGSVSQGGQTCYAGTATSMVSQEELSSEDQTRSDESLKKKKKNKAKPKAKKIEGKPRRPLSAYNLFFQAERKVLLDKLPVRPQGKPRRSHGKMPFVQMARFMGSKWKSLDQEARAVFEDMAVKDKARYEKEMEAFTKNKDQKSATTPTLPTETETEIIDPVILSEPIYVFDEDPIDQPERIVDLALKLDNDMIDILVKALAY